MIRVTHLNINNENELKGSKTFTRFIGQSKQKEQKKASPSKEASLKILMG